jgi:hypothetical protein
METAAVLSHYSITMFLKRGPASRNSCNKIQVLPSTTAMKDPVKGTQSLALRYNCQALSFGDARQIRRPGVQDPKVDML